MEFGGTKGEKVELCGGDILGEYGEKEETKRVYLGG